MAQRMSGDIADVARRRTRAMVATIAAVLLGLAFVVAGLVVAFGHPGDPVPGPAVVTVVPETGTASGPAQPGKRAAVRWSTVAGARVPVSEASGPFDSHNGRARGFAHTQLGAVLAAANISVRLSPQAGPSVFEPTVHEQVAGPDADALLEQLEEDYQAARAQLGLPYGASAGRLYSTTIGFQAEMQGTDAATVRLLIEGPGHDGGSVLVSLATLVQWTGADWLLQAPNRGDWNTDAAVVTDSSGYTRFPDGG
jgi:hypothetical protein